MSLEAPTRNDTLAACCGLQNDKYKRKKLWAYIVKRNPANSGPAVRSVRFSTRFRSELQFGSRYSIIALRPLLPLAVHWFRRIVSYRRSTKPTLTVSGYQKIATCRTSCRISPRLWCTISHQRQGRTRHLSRGTTFRLFFKSLSL